VWLRLPVQQTTSNSDVLLTFAHCPDFKLLVSGRRRAHGGARTPHDRLGTAMVSVVRQWRDLVW
jgi:hypothetical protein